MKPEPNGEWEISHNPIKLTRIGQQLFNFQRDDDSKEPSGKDTIYLHQMHLDYVVKAPQYSEKNKELLSPDTKVHVWGTSEHTGVQGCYIQKRLFTSQGHMEFNEDMVKRQLEMRVKNGALDKEHADEAAEKADWMHDGLLVAKAVVRFFHGDDDMIKASEDDDDDAGKTNSDTEKTDATGGEANRANGNANGQNGHLKN